MRQPSYAKQFERDVKRMRKRGKELSKLKEVLQAVIEEKVLEERYKDHVLIGNYKGRRECHLEPDWLLIYKVVGSEVIFERTGTHSDLFK
jgi:mRNA interferase YafQ